MEELRRALPGRAAARAGRVLAIADELLVYRKARAALAGPALADWTGRYEALVTELTGHAVDGLNEVFDVGAWPLILQLLAASPGKYRAADLVAALQGANTACHGDRAGAAFAAGGDLLAGSSVEIAGAGDGVRIAITRGDGARSTLELTSRRTAGDTSRVTPADLGRQRAFAVGRRGGMRASAGAPDASLGSVDLYGAVVSVCRALRDRTRREVRTARRFGRVRVEGEAVLIALAIWFVAIIALWTTYVLACTGIVVSDNAPNKDSDACKVLNVIAAVVTLAIGLLLFGLFTAGSQNAAAGGTGSSMAYNLNPDFPGQG
jgi:hypothetical protein